MTLRRGKKDTSARRRKLPPKAKEKLPGGQPEIALARNVAELEARIVRGNRTAITLRITMGRLAAQKEMLLKVAQDLSETETFDMEIFEELRQKELEDAGVLEAETEEEEEDDGELE